MNRKRDSVPWIPASARRTLILAAVLPAWFSTLALLVFFAAGFSVPERWQYLPFAASLVFLGLPHGAVDHLVPARLSGRSVTPGSVLAVAGLYAAFAAAVLVLWFISPLAAFALFIAVTWFHWGQGDLYALRAVFGVPYLDSRYARVLAVFVRGGLPMLVPLLVFPRTYESVATSAVALFGGDMGGTFHFGPGFAAVGSAGLAAAGACSLALGYRRSRADRGAWLVDAGETLLLLGYLAVVPPVLAVGAYFCLWHAPRHIARLMLLDGPSAAALERGWFVPAAARFLRDSAPLTLLAIVLLAGLYVLVPRMAGGWEALLGVYLVLLSALTPPHVAVVSLMDRRQGFWS